jgi:hypothetical protein
MSNKAIIAIHYLIIKAECWRIMLEDLFDNIDISRTIGWFTSVFPMVFSIDLKAQPPTFTINE